MPADHFGEGRILPRPIFAGPAGSPLKPRGAGICLTSLILCLWSSAPPAAAQGLNLGAVSEDRPIAISATSGIEWQQDAQVYIARGNATAKRGTTEVHADTLTAHYRPIKAAGSETEIYRLNADGHVTIKGETQTVVGDQAVWDVDQQIGIVTGKALKLTTTTDVVTARDSLEWYDQKQIAVARGDAVAVRENVKRVRADVLTAHMTKGKTTAAETKPGYDRQNLHPPRRRPSQEHRRGCPTAARAPESAASMHRAMSSSRPRPISAAAIMASTTPIPGSSRYSATSRLRAETIRSGVNTPSSI